MAIIPKGRFQSRAASGVSRPNLPSDGAAKPYMAMAQLGDTMAQLGTEMYQRQKRDDIDNSVNSAETEYSTRAAQRRSELQNLISDEGKIGQQNYSEAYTNSDQEIIDDISGRLSGEARTAFLNRIQAQSRGERVRSIGFQTEHKLKRFRFNFEKDTEIGASGLSLADEGVNQKAYDNYKNRQRLLAEKVASGNINEGEATRLVTHAGTSYANAAANSAILRGDVVEFNSLFGIEILNSEGMKAYIEANGLEMEAEKIKKTFVNVPQDPRMSELTDYLSVKDRVKFVNRMLNSMNQQNNLRKSDIRIKIQETRAKARDPEIPASKLKASYEQSVTQLADNMRDAGMSAVEIQAQVSMMEAEFAAKEVLENLAMMPAEQAVQAMRVADDAFQHESPVAKEYYQKQVQTQFLKNQAELAKSPANYVYKNSPEVRNAFSDVSLADPSSLGKAMDYSRLMQRKLGVPENKVQMAPDSVIETFSKALNDSMAADDGQMVQATRLITGLKQGTGEKFAAFMNELDERGKLQSKALIATSWIEDPVLMRENLEAVAQIDMNKKSFDRKNNDRQTSGKKQVAVNKVFFDAVDDKMDVFMQVHGRNAARRRESLVEMIKARFYQNMSNKELSSSEAKSQMKAAYESTVGKMFDKVSFGKSTMMVPKMYNLDEPTIKAGVKVLLRETKQDILEGRVDFDRLPMLSDRFKTPEAFLDRFGSELRVLHPAADGDRGVLRVYFDTTSGRIPLPLKPGPFSTSEPVKQFFLKDLDSDLIIMNQKTEDAKGWFNFGK